MTEPADRIFHQWYVIERNAKCQERLRLLGWRMTQGGLSKGRQHGKVLEVGPG